MTFVPVHYCARAWESLTLTVNEGLLTWHSWETYLSFSFPSPLAVFRFPTKISEDDWPMLVPRESLINATFALVYSILYLQ